MQRVQNEIETIDFTCPIGSNDQTKTEWAQAVAAYHYVSRTVVYGASTRRDDVIRTGFFVCKQIRDAREKNFGSTEIAKIRYSAMNALQYRAGNCFEQTALGIIYLLSRGCYSLHMFNMQGGDHVFLSIGLTDESDLLKQKNIPAEAIIVDIWKQKIYFATEFPRKAVAHQAVGISIETPTMKWSFTRDGLWESSEDKDAFSASLKQFLIQHAHTSENELRSHELITGHLNKPEKFNQAALMQEIRKYQKSNIFKYKKSHPAQKRTYANETGFEYLIEKMADNLLGVHLINEVLLDRITLDMVMPLSRVPDFNVHSLHKEILSHNEFINKFNRMHREYKSISTFYFASSANDCSAKFSQLVRDLEEHLEYEIAKKNTSP